MTDLKPEKKRKSALNDKMFQDSSEVEWSPVKAFVAGSIPAPGAKNES
jgi:hypothetical protein